MFSGIASSLLAKLAGLGTAAKTVLAAGTAAATMAVVGATGIVPVTGGTDGVVEVAGPVSGSVHGDVTNGEPSQAGAAVDVNAGGSEAAAGGTVDVPSGPSGSVLPTTGLPVPGLPAGLPVALPGCLTSLVPAPGAVPDPTRLAAELPDCVDEVLASVPGVPAEVSACVSALVHAVSANPTGLPGTGLSGVDLGGCVPVDTSRCTSQVMGWAEAVDGGGFGAGSLPDFSTLFEGCAPFDATACLGSVLGGLPGLASGSTVGVGDMDLSSCVPAGAVPGLSSIPGLGSLPGLSGFPFFS